MEHLYSLSLKNIWQQLKKEHFSFWAICGYLFVEYVRPQSIIPALDFLPWAKVLLVLAIAGVFADKTCKWVRDPANKWMVLFLAVILLSSWQAYSPQASFSKLDSFYTWLIIYFLIINIVNTPQRFFIFLGIFIIASFKISLSLAIKWAKRGFSFTSWGLMGPPGFFQNSGELAIQMAVFFPIAFAVATQLRPHISNFKFYILSLMPITAGMTILGSSSRGGQIALVAQMAIMFWRRLFNIKVLIGITLAIFLVIKLLPEEQKQRFSSAGSDRTSQQRLLYWEHGWDMMRAHPFLGVGFFNFVPYYEANFPEDMLYTRAELPHNIFVQVGTDTGFTGIAIFLLLIFRSYRAARTANQLSVNPFLAGIGKALNQSLLGFLIAGQFVTVTYYPFFWINLALSVAIANITLLHSTPVTQRSK